MENQKTKPNRRTPEEIAAQRSAAQKAFANRQKSELRGGVSVFRQNLRARNIVKQLRLNERINKKEIARELHMDWDEASDFHMRDPSISKLRIAAGTNAFYDPAHSLTNQTGKGRLVTEGARR